MKRFVNIIFLLIIGLSLSTVCNGQVKKKKAAQKSSFESSSFKKDNNPPDVQGTPGPGGGEGGNPVPISGGLGLLVVGSFIFWGKKIKNELSDE